MKPSPQRVSVLPCACACSRASREWPLSRAVMLHTGLFSPGQDYHSDLGSQLQSHYSISMGVIR